MAGKLFEGLRDFLGCLRAQGEVHAISEPVDKAWEVGTICREVFDREGPAVLFERVGDHRTPLLVGALATRRRYSLALGVEPTVHRIAGMWRQAYADPIKPRVVGDAPCKEVIRRDVDLFADPFPVPRWHPLDRGPELGTLHGVITVDPDTGWTNFGTYRNEILDRDRLGCLVIPYRHIGLHWAKWKALGKAMPVAIAIGLDPYLTLTAVSAVPAGTDEYEIAGGLKGAPIDVVRAQLSDLLVPAHAEIILEGEMPVDEFAPAEAPFGEFTGYMGTARTDSHFIRIRAVTHRRDPIFQGTYEGRPPSESTTVRHLGRSAALFEHLRRAGIAGIVNVCVTPAGCAGFHAVVAIKKTYPGHVRDVMGHVWGHPTMFCKHCFVVDDDIDPWNPTQVEWAVATRVQAGRDVEIVRNGKSIVLDPSQVPSRRGWSDLMGIDATKPLDEYAREKEEFPPSTDPLPEWTERVRSRWTQYGFRALAGLAVAAAAWLWGGPGAGAAAADKVTFASVGAGAVGVITEVVKTQRFDEQNGIALEVSLFNPADAEKAVLYKKVDAGIFAPISAARVNLRGERLRIFGPLLLNHTSIMIPASSPARTLADLKGKKLGIIERISSAYTSTAAIFRRRGFDLEKDFQLVISTPPVLVGLLEKREVDAIVIWEPVVSQLIAGERARELERLEEVWEGLSGGAPMLFIGATAHQEWLDANRETARRTARALADAIQYIRTSPEMVETAKKALGWRTAAEAALMRARLPRIYPAAWDDTVIENARSLLRQNVEMKLLEALPKDDIFVRW